MSSRVRSSVAVNGNAVANFVFGQSGGISGSSEAYLFDNRSVGPAVTYPGSALAGSSVGSGVVNDTTITTFSAPNLSTISGALSLRNNSRLTSVSIPNLSSVSGSLSILLNPITSVSLLELSSVSGFLSVGEHSSLTTVELSRLNTISGNLSLSNSYNLVSLELGDSLNISGTVDCSSCLSLATPAFGVSSLSDGFTITFNGSALAQTAVDGLLSACAAAVGSTASGTIDISGGTNASPTGGTGNAAYITLTSAGITVNTN